VVEFNCRLGDPEAQVVLPAMDGDLAALFWGVASGERWQPAERRLQARRAAVTTVLAAKGYPDAPVKGTQITLKPQVSADSFLYHAGTIRDAQGVLRTAGGRVFSATGFGKTVAQAAEASRRLAERVEFEGKVWRRDIGWREAARTGPGR
jgi:phosphoribosylamine--glycine ligase